MRKLLVILMLVIWGAWFGGLLTLFLAATALFSTFPDRHDLAGAAASAIFLEFNRCQLLVAAAALLVSFLWRALVPGRHKVSLFSTLAAASVAAVIVGAWVAPKLETLRQQGLTTSTHFKQLHGLSMGIYLAETIALLIAGVFLAASMASANRQPEGKSDSTTDKHG